MNARFRRGACPTLWQPMPAGDGLLVRMTPKGATIPCERFVELCGAARRYGNGVIEVTSRGSIQIRGLTETSAEPFAAAVADIERRFFDAGPVSCDPLAGLDPEEVVDASVIIPELRSAIAAASLSAILGPKVSVLVDTGGALHLDALSADIRLRASASNGRSLLAVTVGGDAATEVPIGAVTVEHAVEAVLRMLGIIAARGREARARSIVAMDGADIFRKALANLLLDLAPPPLRPQADPIGVHALVDGRVAAGVGLAFGHMDSSILEELTRTAAKMDACGVRTAPGRALLVIGPTIEAAARITEIAERLGFIVHTEDPRRRVVACAGAPVCASAEIPARSLAPELAAIAAAVSDDATMLHVSGCAKGCACPRSVPLTVVGIAGRCGLVVNGCARDVPLALFSSDDLPDALSRLAKTAQCSRAPDESVAAALSRLDPTQIVHLIQADTADD